ncbi:MAG: hypothetical protein LBU83_08760, partial [Bacteroidales bacterium]|nr:hypothetical protein [Bacteroidales bacterium]
MELDEIKNKWSETDVLKGKLQVNDNRIKEMLKNEGESVLSKLIRTTKFSIIIPIPAGLLVCLHSYSCSFEGYYMILPLIFLLICILLVPLNSHRYRLLKGIDYSRMSVKEVSEKILKYQNNVQKWQVYHTIGFFVFLGVWYFLYHKLILGSEI